MFRQRFRWLLIFIVLLFPFAVSAQRTHRVYLPQVRSDYNNSYKAEVSMFNGGVDVTCNGTLSSVIGEYSLKIASSNQRNVTVVCFSNSTGPFTQITETNGLTRLKMYNKDIAFLRGGFNTCIFTSRQESDRIVFSGFRGC